jgi:hypothetical protein
MVEACLRGFSQVSMVRGASSIRDGRTRRTKKQKQQQPSVKPFPDRFRAHAVCIQRSITGTNQTHATTPAFFTLALHPFDILGAPSTMMVPIINHKPLFVAFCRQAGGAGDKSRMNNSHRLN